MYISKGYTRGIERNKEKDTIVSTKKTRKDYAEVKTNFEVDSNCDTCITDNKVDCSLGSNLRWGCEFVLGIVVGEWWNIVWGH